METRQGAVIPEARFDASPSGRYITGYAAVYYRSDDPGTEFRNPYFRERIAPGAFDRAIAEADDVRALVNHNPDWVLGRASAGTLTLQTNKRGLLYSIPYDEGDPDHQRIKRKLEKGEITGSSFAFVPTDEDRDVDDEGEYRVIKEVSLHDVGPVTFPAYPSASSGMRSQEARLESLEKRILWLEHQLTIMRSRV